MFGVSQVSVTIRKSGDSVRMKASSSMILFRMLLAFKVAIFKELLVFSYQFVFKGGICLE